VSLLDTVCESHFMFRVLENRILESKSSLFVCPENSLLFSIAGSPSSFARWILLTRLILIRGLQPAHRQRGSL